MEVVALIVYCDRCDAHVALLRDDFLDKRYYYCVRCKKLLKTVNRWT